MLNAFVLKYESKPLPKSKKKLIRLLLNIDANAGRDALQKLYPNLVERWLKFGDTFKKVPEIFASEPKWVIDSQQELDAYYFAEAGIKPFWVRRSDITNALDQLTPDERADLEIVAKALTASNLDAAREALETISAKYPDVGVHWILDRLGSHTPKAV